MINLIDSFPNIKATQRIQLERALDTTNLRAYSWHLFTRTYAANPTATLDCRRVSVSRSGELIIWGGAPYGHVDLTFTRGGVELSASKNVYMSPEEAAVYLDVNTNTYFVTVTPTSWS